jgi:uroporphyrinogen-III decarboxylase
MGQVVGHPLEEWSALDTFDNPDPDDSAWYEGMDRQLEETGDTYVLTSTFMLLFERLHALRGFENVLMDLYLERERVEKLADSIVEFDLRIIENISSRFPGQIHGFTFTDDWGTERNTIVSKELWDDFFKPRYKRIFDVCKDAGWHVWMHSCGRINKIIPSLIEIGCDVLNLQQPTTNGIEETGTEFAGRICFQTLCDIQHTLPFKSADEIRAEARQLLEYWSVPSGGFILSDYGDGRAIGVSDEKKRIMLDAFLEADPWKDPVTS